MTNPIDAIIYRSLQRIKEQLAEADRAESPMEKLKILTENN